MSEGEERRLEALRAQLRATPGDLRIRRQLADRLERHGLDGAALLEWHHLFVIYREAHRVRHAAAVCRNALRLRPRHVHWRVRLACCLMTLELRAEAAHHLEVAMHHALHPVDQRVTRRLWQLARPEQTLAA